MILGRRAAVGRRGPGLIGAAARTAVVAGTATAVTSGMRRRRAEKDAEAEQAAAYQAQQQQQAAAQAAPSAQPAAGDDSIAQLERLATLKQQGVLSDAEFAAAKAKVLGI